MERAFSSDKRKVLGIPVSISSGGDIGSILARRPGGKPFLCTFVNPHACFVHQRDPGYPDVLEAFDKVACDGIGMVIACRHAGLKAVRREAFDLTSLAVPVFNWAADNDQKVVLVGGEPEVAEKAASILVDLFPGLKIVACFSGFGDEPARAQQFISDERPDIVVCGMGVPAQERFLLELARSNWAGAGFTCGGFLDQTALGGAYFPDWVDHMNVRFLYRLAREPSRLWRRYLLEYQVFLRRFIRALWAGQSMKDA